MTRFVTLSYLGLCLLWVWVWSRAWVCSGWRCPCGLVGGKDVINKVSVLGSRMHPGSFQTIFLLEEGVCDDHLLFYAELQQKSPIVIAVSNTMFADSSFPGFWVLTHCSAEGWWPCCLLKCSAGDCSSQHSTCLFLQGWFAGLAHAEYRGVFLVMEREAHRDDTVRATSGHIFEAVEFLTMKPLWRGSVLIAVCRTTTESSRHHVLEDCLPQQSRLCWVRRLPCPVWRLGVQWG